LAYFTHSIKPIEIFWMALFVALLVTAAYYARTFRKRQYDLIGMRNKFFIISGVLFAISILSLLVNGLGIGGGKLNFSLEFTGGTILELGFEKQDITSDNINLAIQEYNSKIDNASLKLKKPIVQMEGSMKTVDYPEKYRQIDLILKKKAGGAITAQELKGIAAPLTESMGRAIILEETFPEGEQVTLKVGFADLVEKKPAAKSEEETKARIPRLMAAVAAFDKNIELVDAKEGEVVPLPKEIKKSKDFKSAIVRVVKENNQNLNADDVLQLVSAMTRMYGEVYKFKVESIGPSIGKELAYKAALAIIISLLIQLIYISLRFAFQGKSGLIYGFAADVALLHDVIIMTGIYSFVGREFDSPFLAALLTVIGYSVMDSIVIFDRIRENLKIMKKETYEEAVNVSVNQTMSRSVNTLLTVLLTLFALYFFGGATLKNFAFALLIGCTLGGYSSIFIASPILVLIDDWNKKKEADRVARRRAELAAASQARAKSAVEAPAQKDVTPQDIQASEEAEREADRKTIKAHQKGKKRFAKAGGKKK
jgi:preprotein translocase subunit SecF